MVPFHQGDMGEEHDINYVQDDEDPVDMGVEKYIEQPRQEDEEDIIVLQEKLRDGDKGHGEKM